MATASYPESDIEEVCRNSAPKLHYITGRLSSQAKIKKIFVAPLCKFLRGFIFFPPGSGRTHLTCQLRERQDQPVTLIITELSLFHQWRDQLKRRGSSKQFIIGQYQCVSVNKKNHRPTFIVSSGFAAKFASPVDCAAEVWRTSAQMSPELFPSIAKDSPVCTSDSTCVVIDTDKYLRTGNTSRVLDPSGSWWFLQPAPVFYDPIVHAWMHPHIESAQVLAVMHPTYTIHIAQ